MDQHLLRRGVADLFTSARRRTCRVGVELELVARDARDDSVVRIDRVRRAARGASYAAWLGFEPGGQVELSLPCFRTVDELDRAVQAMSGSLHADCAAAGVLLEPEPTDNRGCDVPLQLTTSRYTEMQRHFDRIGPAGRTMMRRTASSQVCLDWWPGPVGQEQWQVLQLAGPTLAALFARSAGPRSRLATWLEVDPGRTAFDGRLLDHEPIAAYTDFAAGATAFATPAAVRDRVPHHLSTLFPPVRPRGGYLEVRFLDAQPAVEVSVAAALLAILMFDDQSRSEAVHLLEGERTHLARHWRLAATAPGELAEQGRALVELCLPGLRRATADYVPEWVEDRLREHLDEAAPAGAA